MILYFSYVYVKLTLKVYIYTRLLLANIAHTLLTESEE